MSDMQDKLNKMVDPEEFDKYMAQFFGNLIANPAVDSKNRLYGQMAFEYVCAYRGARDAVRRLVKQGRAHKLIVEDLLKSFDYIDILISKYKEAAGYVDT